MRILSFLILSSSLISAMEPGVRTVWEPDERGHYNYNPFREGFIKHEFTRMIPNFENVYAAFESDIMQDFGPEIIQFCKQNELANGAQAVKRYTLALVARLALKRPGSRKIDVVKTTIPANLAEFNYILGRDKTPKGHEYTHDSMRQELHNFFELLKTADAKKSKKKKSAGI